jgi:hypothetical protein
MRSTVQVLLKTALLKMTLVVCRDLHNFHKLCAQIPLFLGSDLDIFAEFCVRAEPQALWHGLRRLAKDLVQGMRCAHSNMDATDFRAPTEVHYQPHPLQQGCPLQQFIWASFYDALPNTILCRVTAPVCYLGEAAAISSATPRDRSPLHLHGLKMVGRWCMPKTGVY